MPTSSYLTTRNSTYLSSSPDTSYRKTSFVPRTSFSSSIGNGDLGYRRFSSTSYRHYGDDSSSSSTSAGSTSISRFGVSSTRTSSSTSIPSSSLTRTSIDRDSRKPPLGLTTSGSARLRSESRIRDLSLDNGYTLSTKYSSPNCNDTSTSTLKNLNRLSTSSLARSVATSGADLYAKYSPSNYKSNCELSRSRSLTDSTVDSISGNNSSHLNGTSSRAASKDRSSSSTSFTPSASSPSARTNGSLLAGNSAIAKDYLSNRSSSPISTSASIKVKPCATNHLGGVLPTSLSHSRCSYSNATSSTTNSNSNSINNNQNHNLKKTNNAINNNNNALSESIAVSAAITNLNSKKPSADSVHKFPVKKLPISSTSSALNASRPISTAKNSTSSSSTRPMNSSLNTSNANASSCNNNSTVKCSVTSSESFKKRLGTNPLSPYKNPDFLKCEYDLARSQVINSRSKSASSEPNNNTINNSSVARVPSPAKDSNLNKITIFGVNESPRKLSQTIGDEGTATDSENNMNCVEYTNVDLLDDIKFIDSDDSDRKYSPGAMKVSSTKEFFSDAASLSKNSATATLPSNSSAKKMNDIYQNKYNTISNGNGPHQIHIQIGNDIGGNGVAARKAIAEDMASSTSSSTSTLSAMTESSTSSFQPNKETTPSTTTKASNSEGKEGNAADNVSVFHSVHRAVSLLFSCFLAFSFVFSVFVFVD